MIALLDYLTDKDKKDRQDRQDRVEAESERLKIENIMKLELDRELHFKSG